MTAKKVKILNNFNNFHGRGGGDFFWVAIICTPVMYITFYNTCPNSRNLN